MAGPTGAPGALRNEMCASGSPGSGPLPAAAGLCGGGGRGYGGAEDADKGIEDLKAAAANAIGAEALEDA